MAKAQRINGQTWTEWAQELFEFEYCEECHKGVRGHLKAIFLGNWFAYCKNPPIEEDKLTRR